MKHIISVKKKTFVIFHKTTTKENVIVLFSNAFEIAHIVQGMWQIKFF